MNELIKPTQPTFKPKTFWERPEGATGQLVAVAALGIGGYLLVQALPAVIALLQNTLYAAALGALAAALLYLVSDRRTRRLGAYLYQSLMRRITQVFVEIDPIGILENYARELERKLQSMGQRIASLNGMMRACQEEIRSNERSKHAALMMVKEASKSGKALVVAEESRQAGRLQEANLTYSDLLAKMQLLYSVLAKYQDISRFLLKDMRREIDVQKRRKQMIEAAHSAIRSAKSILNGDPDARAMFDLANEYLANDYALKIGEIEDFVRMSDAFVATIDLQNGVYQAEALRMIEDWERRGDSMLLGPDAKRLLVEGSYSGGAAPGDDVPPRDAGPKQWFGQQ